MASIQSGKEQWRRNSKSVAFSPKSSWVLDIKKQKKQFNSSSEISPYNQIEYKFRNNPIILKHTKCFQPADYFCCLENSKYRGIFILAHYNALPSAILEDRHHHIPLPQWLCPCHAWKVESVLLHWLFYNNNPVYSSDPVNSSRKTWTVLCLPLSFRFPSGDN